VKPYTFKLRAWLSPEIAQCRQLALTFKENQRREHDSWQVTQTDYRSCVVIVAEGMHSEKKLALLLTNKA